MRRPRHIALLNAFFAPHRFGGATVVAESVARALWRDHGIRTSAISAMHRSDLPPYEVLRTGAGPGLASWLINLPRDRSYTEIYDNPRVTEVVARLLDRIAPDLVHAHSMQDLGAGILPMVRDRGLPLVLSVHDHWWLSERQFMSRADLGPDRLDPAEGADRSGGVADLPRARIRFQRLAEAAAAADVITFPSRATQQLYDAAGLRGGRHAVWTNGVQPPGPGFFAAQAARRAADPRPVFGYLGGANVVKGWPLLRAAFTGLGRQGFSGLLVAAGHDARGWQGQSLSKMSGDWRILSRFEPAAMDDFYARIDALLFPSQWEETSGLVLREAAARGIAVIQTACGGAVEWDGADQAAMIPVGAGPEVLAEKLRDFLDRHPNPPAPRPQPGPSDQAAALLRIIKAG
jgi:glycosyltransferase involved in cell wall biosynthesis